MLHLYEIDEDGEVFAANSEEQAKSYYIELTGKEPEYVELQDDETVVPDYDNPSQDPSTIGKTYAEVAAECRFACQVFSGYC